MSKTPKTGRILGEDGQTYNIVDLLGGGNPVSEVTHDIRSYTPMSGRIIGEDGQVYNLVDLLQNAGGGGSSIPDGSVTLSKLAQEVLTRIDQHKFTPLSGSGNDANHLTETGIYFNIGGYGLQNAPRNNYGWMLIVSRGTSNDHHRGAQVYFDHDGFDWRGYDGGNFTNWQTCIVKNAVEGIEPIADPTNATLEDVANAYNALLTELKG